MKKCAIFFLLLLPLLGKSSNYIAQASGNWNTPGTWVGSPIVPPGPTDNVIITNGYTVTVDYNPSNSVDNITIANGNSLVMGSSGGVTLNVYGNIFNSGSFLPGSSTSAVIFSGSSNQTISGPPTATTSIYDFTVSPSSSTDTVYSNMTVGVSDNLTIASNDVLCCGGQMVITGSGNMSMAGSTSLLLGLKGSPSNIIFPAYSAAHMSLRSPNTVIYQANGSPGQTVSTTPTYDNLTLLATIPTDAKNFSGTLGVSGNLLVSSCTLNALSSTINVTGNATIAQGTISFSTGSMNIQGNFSNNAGSLTGSSTVTFNGSSAQTIGGSSPTTFYNLTANNSNTVTLGNNETVGNTFTTSSGTTFDVSSSNYRLSVGGNFTNNGTFTCRNGNVIMNGNTNQTISTSSGGLTFDTLTVSQGGASDEVILSSPITVTNLTITDGALNCQANEVTGNASGIMTMDTLTSLFLGSSSATPVPFPRFFVAGNIFLNSGSTVNYQANSSLQTVSDTPTYGNLIIATGHPATAGSPLIAKGNLTINPSTTLGGGITTGALFLGGNITNNGTFAPSTGSTVVFNGSGTQTIGGPDTIPFYNMTVSGGSAQIVQLGYTTEVSNTLRIPSGKLDATTSNYNLIVKGNFTDSGGTFMPRGGIVNMLGSGSQKLGGSTNPLSLNNLVIGSGTITLIGNITATSNITINSGATFSAAGNNINVAGNFTDNGTFNCNTSTVDFDNNGKQCVSGTHTSETFQNLTVGPLSKLGTSCNINIDGTIFIQPGGQMLCACH